MAFKWSALRTIEANGSWKCRACANAMRNIANSKPIGTVRLHKQSGYFEEKSERGWVRQHILVYERHIGRLLSHDEIVHHRNEVKTDNAIGNLELMTHAEHTALHNRGTSHSPETIKRIRDGIANARGYKLNPELAEKIRVSKEKFGLTNAQLADQYQVSLTAIHRVIHKKAWN